MPRPREDRELHLTRTGVLVWGSAAEDGRWWVTTGEGLQSPAMEWREDGWSGWVKGNAVGTGHFMESKIVVEGTPGQVSQKHGRLFESMIGTY